MDDLNKNIQTPEETAQTLSDLAKKLEEMDRAEGFFGESMAEALTDDYLEEVAGGLQAIPLTTPGTAAYYFTCAKCGKPFSTNDSTQSLCGDCLIPVVERKPLD